MMQEPLQAPKGSCISSMRPRPSLVSSSFEVTQLRACTQVRTTSVEATVRTSVLTTSVLFSESTYLEGISMAAWCQISRESHGL